MRNSWLSEIFIGFSMGSGRTAHGGRSVRAGQARPARPFRKELRQVLSSPAVMGAGLFPVNSSLTGCRAGLRARPVFSGGGCA